MSRDSPPTVGIVMPLANEASTIKQLLLEVVSYLGESDRVFCVIDKVSRDETLTIVREISETVEQVHCVWAPENRSVVDAYFRGYKEAFDSGSDWILEMDAGFSHRPEEIPLFLEAMAGGADFAVGSRFTRGGIHKGLPSRHIVSWLGTKLANLMLGTKMTDMTSGFECFTRDSMAHVLEKGVRSRYHFFQTEIRYMLGSRNWVEIPIVYTNRVTTVGLEPIKEAVKNLWTLYREKKNIPVN